MIPIPFPIGVLLGLSMVCVVIAFLHWLFPNRRSQAAYRERSRNVGAGGCQWMFFLGVLIIAALAVLNMSSVLSFANTQFAHLYGAATHNGAVSPNTRHFTRIGQLDCAQYASQQECDTWSGSTCSTTAMTEVMDYYGQNLKITDVLQAQRDVQEITPDLGLLHDEGIARTVSRFGFRATVDHSHTLSQVIDLANKGIPVIVDFPPSSAYPTGHLPVVTGGNDNEVFLADSSVEDLTSLSRGRFTALWNGMTALITPQGGQS